MRTKNPDPVTRRRLIDAAEELMLSKGFVAATVDEICAAAEVTKGSFFHYFSSKEDLGKVLLRNFSHKQQARLMGSCESVADPLDRVYAMIDCAIETSRDPHSRGCLIGTFAQEISETHPDLRAVCKESFEGFAAAVSRDLAAAKKRCAPRASFDARGLGDCLMALVQGSLLIRKATGDRKAMGRNLLHFKQYLKRLYGR